ncbi:MAG: hypothetical protein ACK4E0_09360 [Chitinophagaceae bacterium]
MKYFYLIVVTLFAISCTNNICKSKPISGYVYIDMEKEISLSQLIEIRKTLIEAEIDRMGEISGYDSNKHSLQLKIYTSFGDTENEKLFVLEKINSKWMAKELRYQFDISAMQDTIYIRINAIKDLTPQISWEAFYDSLRSSNIFKLSGDHTLEGYEESMGIVDGVEVVFRDKSDSNRYSYREIELNKKFREVEDLDKVLNFIEGTFDGKYIYRSCFFREK